jgi:adenylate kinase family enzyme
MGHCVRSTTISLYNLQDDYTRKRIIAPLWQRGDVWKPDAKRSFYKTILNKAKRGTDILCGCIILYTTDDTDDVTYISDGLQRTMNAQKLFNNLVAERGVESARTVMEKISINVLYMRYQDDDEAKNEFRLLNQGTPLEAQDHGKTILVDLPGYEAWDARIFKPLSESIKEAMYRQGVKNSKKKNVKQPDWRDDLAMFLRYLTKDKSTTSYSFAVGDITDPKIREKVLEQKFVDLVDPLGLDETEKRLKAFSKFIFDQSAYIQDIWKKIDKTGWDKNIVTITPAMFRFLLHVAIWRKNNEIPIIRFEEFAKKLLTQATGKAMVPFDSGGYSMVAKGGVRTLPIFQERLDITIDPNYKPSLARKKRKTAQTPMGFNNAHVFPFAKTMGSDDGETVLTTAVANMSLGPNPIPETELVTVT